MKITSALSLVVVCTLFSGCAGSPPTKTLRELDVRRASIVAGNGEMMVVIDGLSSKGSGAVVGGAKGAGAGVGIAAVGCIATGPFYPLCLVAAGAAAGAVGAAGGAVVGAVTTEGADKVSTKRRMLTEAISALDANQRLAVLIHQKSLETPTIDPLYAGKEPAILVSEWTLRIVVNELATVGSGPDAPYTLKVSTRVEITHSGSDNPVLVKEYQAQNPAWMHTTEWRAKDDELVRTTIDDLLATLATDILNDFSPIQLSLDKTLLDYIVQGENGDTDSVIKPSAVLSSEENNNINSVAKESDSDSPPHLFDPKTKMNWLIMPSSPVDLSTANINCASLETGDKKKYRIPSLREFEELWTRYKDDERLCVFIKREYIADSKNLFGSTAYPQTFSFASGNPGQTGQLRAAYLTCVSR